jgi:hypothetical protein
MPELEPIVQQITTPYDNLGILSFIKDLGAVGTVAGVATVAIGAVTGAVVASVKATMDWGLQLDDIQKVMGGTTDQAAGLKLSADALGISTELITNKMILLSKGLENAKGAAGASANELDKLHINYRNMDGTLMDSNELLQSIANHFADMANGTQKNNELASLFGRNISGLNEYMTQIAGDGMQKYINMAKQMGLVLSSDQVDGIHKLSMNINILKDQFTGIAVILGQAFIPAVQSIVSWIGQAVTGITPAIEHFGKFLGVLLNVAPAADSVASSISSMGAATNNNPWFSMGKDVKGFAPGDLYAQANGAGGYNYNIGKPVEVTITNTADIAKAMPMPGQASIYQGHGEDLVLSPFEMAVQSFVDAVKTDWPPFEAVINAMIAGLAPIKWETFGQNMVVAIKTLADVMNGPVFKVLSASAARSAGVELPDDTPKFASNWTNPHLLEETVGGWFSELFTQAPADMKPVTPVLANTLNGTVVNTLNNNHDTITTKFNTFSTDLQTRFDEQRATNIELNLTLLKLPSLISAAVATGK